MKHTNDNLFDENLTGDRIDRLGKNFSIIENPKTRNAGKDFPLRDNTVMSVIVLGGSMECIVDMTVHHINVPGMLLVLPFQIVENFSFSDDFKGYCIIMASSFLANMPMAHKVPLILDVKQTGFYPMNGHILEAVVNYAHMVQSALRTDSSKYKHEIITHLTIAYYYGLGTYVHNIGSAGSTLTRYGEISDRFMELVRENCHAHRDMEFYSNALCLSAKHVSFAVRKVTGDNAMKWIERYTVLRAKSLLKTSGLSISEISDSLNFPTPSDFGKYFKKFTGYSPKAFRNTEA